LKRKSCMIFCTCVHPCVVCGFAGTKRIRTQRQTLPLQSARQTQEKEKTEYAGAENAAVRGPEEESPYNFALGKYEGLKTDILLIFILTLCLLSTTDECHDSMDRNMVSRISA
jgi:hypothetical protein